MNTVRLTCTVLREEDKSISVSVGDGRYMDLPRSQVAMFKKWYGVNGKWYATVDVAKWLVEKENVSMNMLHKLLTQWRNLRASNEMDFVYVTELADRVIYGDHRKLTVEEFKKLNELCLKYR